MGVICSNLFDPFSFSSYSTKATGLKTDGTD